MTEAEKKQIDEMDYESMLRMWRTAPAGDPMFQGETGRYFREAMDKKRLEIGNAEHVRASKNIG